MEFNVIIFNFNAKKFEKYNIFPYFERCYKEEKKKPVTFEEFKEFFINNSRYMYWSRCEYEIILQSWPTGMAEEKWDIHKQIMMNIDIIVKLFMENIK